MRFKNDEDKLNAMTILKKNDEDNSLEESVKEKK
jgi:hypothetical protein